ncbi:hypothetical protein [Agrobacterium tumefaciens]|nr:hypothetical protein [Agrobacterium tumefaciens]
MKNFVSVLIKPLAMRFGALAASALSGAMAVDPSLSAKFEAWVVAGLLLLADFVFAGKQAPKPKRKRVSKPKTQEVR